MRTPKGILAVLLFLFSIVVPSHSDALPTLSVTDGTNSATLTINSTPVAGSTAGCLGDGYTCYSVNTTSLSWVTLSQTPIISVKDSTTVMNMALNLATWQGSSSTTGTLTITMTNAFTNTLVAGSNPFGLVESGSFKTSSGNVVGDKLTLLGQLNGTSIGQISKTAPSGSLSTSTYSLALSPLASVTCPVGGCVAPTLKYILTYNYTNSGGSTSQLLDVVGEGVADSDGGINEQLYQFGLCGGTANCNPTFDTAANELPEPSSLLLLGSGLVGLAGWARKRASKQA